MKILLLNGPPRSGKDTAGEFISRRAGPNARIFKFAGVLKDMVHGAFGLYGVAPNHFEDVKDQPQQLFLGKTPREMYISMSEDWFKPLYGKDVYGKFLAQKIESFKNAHGELAIVTDSGFREEAEVLVKTFGAENILLLRVYREGHGFSNDSRSYIDLSDYGVRSYDIDNVDIEEFKKEALSVTREHLQL